MNDFLTWFVVAYLLFQGFGDILLGFAGDNPPKKPHPVFLAVIGMALLMLLALWWWT